MPSDDYSVTIEPALAVANPHGNLRFTALITRTPASRAPGQVLFALEYTLAESSTHIVTAAMPVANGNIVSPVLTISLQTVTNTLLDRRSRNAFVVLANASENEVRVDDIRALSEQFVGVAFTPPPVFPLVIPAQRSTVVTMTVAAGNQVQPGNWFVLVQVDSSWQRDKRQFQASQILRSDLDVGVYAESGILTALVLPILLFLPGAIFVWLLGKLLGARVNAQADIFKFDFATTRDFVAATVITSIFIVILYRFTGGAITQILFGVSVARDITLAYGFVDIASIVILAAILAGIVAALWIVVLKLKKAISDWNTQRKKDAEALRVASLTLREGDDTLTVIQKLARNKCVFKDIEGRVYRLKAEPVQTANVFVLRADTTTPDKVWVAPAIHLTWHDEQSEEAKACAVLLQSSSSDDGLTLATLLEASQKSGSVILDWVPTLPAAPWPRSVPRADLIAPYSDERFLG